jgi:hypothetical protein
MPIKDHKSYICKECNKKTNSWSESEIYKEHLCPDCYDKKHGGWKSALIDIMKKDKEKTEGE